MSGQRCLEILSELVEYSCGREFADQMEIAREFFVVATGKVTDDDAFFESRMNVFQQWFVFDFRLSDVFSGSTIFETYLFRKMAAKVSVHEAHELEQFRTVRRSLFKVERAVGEAVVVRDLFSQSTLEVSPLPETSLAALAPGQVFEARVVCLDDCWYFTGAFIFHPDEVRGFIEKRICEFLVRRTYEPSAAALDWKAELKRRHDVLQVLAEQKRVLEAVEKRKSIEVLNVNRSLAQVANEVVGAPLVMAIGSQNEVSAFVPETPFYDTATLMDALAYSELKSCRYKHIDPSKLYAAENRDATPASKAQKGSLSAR
jgi:hypothetical protein